MITNLFESSEDDIKIIHHAEKNPIVYHEKTTQSAAEKEPVKEEPVQESPKGVPEEIKKDVEETVKEIRSDVKDDNLVNSLFNAVLKEYQKPFSNLPTSVKSSIDTCFKQLESSESKEDVVVALDDLKEVVTTAETLSFKKRSEVFKSVVTSEEFVNEIKKIGENNGYKLELAAFKTTGCYKQLNEAISQVFDSLKTISFDNLKSIDGGKLDGAKNYLLDVLRTPLNKEGELEKSDKAFFDLIQSISPESKKKPKENVKETSVISSQQPKLLQTVIKKCWGRLNNVDKTVLNCYANDQTYAGYVTTGDDVNLISKGISSQMTPEGIVCVCGLAMDKYFPAGEDNGDDEDITLELQKFTYKGGSSTAIIHYGQPKGDKKDSQFFEMRVDPSVKVKNEQGRVELVIRTFDSEDREDDKSKFVTKRGKRASVYETLRMLDGKSEGKGGRRR